MLILNIGDIMTDMTKFNQAVQQSKALRKGLDLPTYILECLANTQERIDNEEIKPIKNGYKTGNGFIRMVTDEIQEELEELAQVIPIREITNPDKE